MKKKYKNLELQFIKLRAVFSCSFIQFFRLPIAWFFYFLPTFLYLLIAFLFKVNINQIIINYVLVATTNVSLMSLGIHFFNMKKSKELKYFYVANLKIFTFIFAISLFYFSLFLIPFLILILIAFLSLSLKISFLYFFYLISIGVVNFLIFAFLSIFIASLIKESNTANFVYVLLLYLSFGVLFLIPFLSKTPIFVSYLVWIVFPGSFFSFFLDSYIQHFFNYWAFGFSLFYIIMILFLLIKYFQWE